MSDQDHRIRYKLVNADGSSFLDTRPSKVAITAADDFDAFLDAVKLKNDMPGFLQDIPATALRVFENEKDLKEDSFIDGDENVVALVGQRIMDKNFKLLVMVPNSNAAKRTKIDDMLAEKLESEERRDFEKCIQVGLKLTDLDLKAGQLLKIDKFLDVEFPQGLFVRQEYLELKEKIDVQLNDPRNKRFLFLGSPGIGKSVFGVLLLLIAIKDKEDFGYCSESLKKVFYVTWINEAYSVTLIRRKDETYSYGFVDGSESARQALSLDFRHTFLFASARSENYNIFEKSNCKTFYVNPWGKGELEAYTSKIGINDDDDVEWLHRFNLIGGKPRYLFGSYISYEGLKAKIKHALPTHIGGLTGAVDAVLSGSFPEGLKHLLFSFYRSDKADDVRYLRFSSLIVEASVAIKYHLLTLDRARNMLNTTDLDLQSWRAKHMERILLEGLVSERVRMKSLVAVPAGTVAPERFFGPLQARTAIINAASEIKCELRLFLPQSKTFPAIDAVLVIPVHNLILYVQSTVSMVHSIKHLALKNVYDDLRSQHVFNGFEHILLFMVSNHIFDQFQPQTYKNQDGSVRSGAIHMDMVQFVGRLV